MNGNTRWLNRNGLKEKKQGNWMDMQDYWMDAQALLLGHWYEIMALYYVK